jgi:thiol:disulfide interchange protein DsbA
MKASKFLLSIISVFFISFTNAEKLKQLVEFFSFTCSHCMSAEPLLQQVLIKTKAYYMPVVMVQTGDQVGTALVYYACIKSGIGWQFRGAYFKAISNGLPPYTPETLVYVLSQVSQNPNEIMKIAKSSEIQQKYALDQQLVQKYHITSTPTWIINNQYAVEGETALLAFLKDAQ